MQKRDKDWETSHKSVQTKSRQGQELAISKVSKAHQYMQPLDVPSPNCINCKIFCYLLIHIFILHLTFLTGSSQLSYLKEVNHDSLNKTEVHTAQVQHLVLFISCNHSKRFRLSTPYNAYNGIPPQSLPHSEENILATILPFICTLQKS